MSKQPELRVSRSKSPRRAASTPKGQAKATIPATQVLEQEQEQASGSAGGLYALAGFCRQFLGAIGKRITLEVEEELRMDAGGEECEVFFALEEDDEDALEEKRSTSDSGKRYIKRRLIQFKFSRQPRTNQISPQELNEIVVAFANSRRRIGKRDTGAEVTTTCIVTSNRELSKMSLAMIDSAKVDAKHNRFQDTSKGEKPKLLWTKDAIKLLAQIQWEKVSAPSLRVPIERRAAVLGVRRSEMNAAVRRVVGFFFDAVSEGGPQPATIEQIDAHLADATGARPLHSKASRQAMYEGLELFRGSTWIGKTPLHSRDVEAALRDLLSRRGLIFICGDGGNGKTSLVYTVLSSGLIAGEGIDPPFRIACLARHWESNLLGKHFQCWRGDEDGKCGGEPREVTLERLQATCGDREVPVLLLGLDALDEKTPDTHTAAIEELLAWGRAEDERRLRGEAARGVLIVTSRLHPKHFHPFFTPYGDAREKTLDEERVLHVGAFNTHEIIGAARLLGEGSLPAELQEAVRHLVEAVSKQELKYGGRLDAAAMLSSTSLSSLPSTPVPTDLLLSAREVYESRASWVSEDEDWLTEIIGSLSHPTLWGCFCELEEGQHSDVLKGDPRALAELSAALLLWFKKKIDLRHPGQSYSAQSATEKVLREAASALRRDGARVGKKREHWLEPATNFGIDRSMAERVWDEAVSSGIISLSAADAWFWRHSFFAQSLIDAEAAQVEP